MNTNSKPIPKFANEAEERAFWESHDTTDYVDWSLARNVSFPKLRPTPKASRQILRTKVLRSSTTVESHGLQAVE